MRNRCSKEKLSQHIRQHKSTFVVYIVLRILVIASLVLAVIRSDYESAFVCLLVLILFMAPWFIQSNFGICFPSTLEIIILLFIFATEMLGEIQCYYVTFKYWDTIMHTINGFICAAVGFSLIEILNRDPLLKFNVSPFFVALVAFCFSMTIGVLWEFFEFAMDRIFFWDMQKDTVLHSISSVALDPTNSNLPIVIKDITSASINGQELGLGGYLDIGLYDTMEDLFVNFVGAFLFSVLGYLNLKRRDGSKFVENFVPTLTTNENKETQAHEDPSPPSVG